jgi:hypothetical protein
LLPSFESVYRSNYEQRYKVNINFEIKISLKHCFHTGSNTNRVSPDKDVLIDKREIHLMLESIKFQGFNRYDHIKELLSEINAILLIGYDMRVYLCCYLS